MNIDKKLLDDIADLVETHGGHILKWEMKGVGSEVLTILEFTTLEAINNEKTN